MIINFLKIIFILLFLNSTTNAHSDIETLLKLKASLLTSKSSALHDWSPPKYKISGSVTDYHCSFSGVTCDGGARVIALKIINTPLFGTIPPEIGLLDNLVNLTLIRTNLTGQLPSEMSKLTSLRHVNLSANTFTGVFRGEIFRTMDNLESFSVYNNNFTGTLPTEFVKLKKLKKLTLGGNYFYGEIPEIYSEFECLESLGLQGNGLTGRIPASLAKLQSLQELCLGYYNVYDGGIPPELGLLSSLKLLDLGGCNLSGEIPPSLGNLKNLHTLFLQINHLSGEIPGELSGLVSLKSLDLSLNELIGEIPDSFKDLKNFTLINLYGNKLVGPIPDFIGELEFLEVLQIWDNNFTFHLPENLGRNGRIYLLDVANNRFTGRIPKDLCKSGKLENLVLMENGFFGPIPEELGGCKSLKKVRLAKNFLDGQIPKGLFNLPSLSMLELNDNYLTGELPTEISGTSLVSLKLSNNWVSGKIVPSIGNLVKLEALSLDMNKFTGEIPEEISKLSTLLNVDFSGNNLTGVIPSSIASCRKLISIDLSRNKLEGEIPVELSKLDSLNSMNLSRNQLSGEIPGEIGMLKGLTVLDLSYNDFVGRRPTTGMLKFIGDRFFAGNPNLCPPHSQSCSSVIKQKQYSSLKIIIIVVMVVFISLLLFITWNARRTKLEKSLVWKLTAFQKLDFRADDVLDCLQEENIIGKGAAGTVYRGSMPNGVDVAIKKLVGRGSSLNDHGFSAEIKTLGRIKHRYIVRLLGYVSNKDTNLLLYEYMSNGSLGELLHGSKGGHLLWETRYRIAIEAAKGLCYLHHDCSPSIIHRDVKSNNILLDSDYEAHVADFGLAKFFQDAGASECMSAVAGSYGYIAPEYAYTLKVDQKSDVYSFGVVLLELIIGRKPVGDFGPGVDIVRWVRETVPKPSDPSSVVAVVDSRLSGYPLTGVINLFKIAMLCVEDESASRPSMREVVHMLTNPPQIVPSLISL